MAGSDSERVSHLYDTGQGAKCALCGRTGNPAYPLLAYPRTPELDEAVTIADLAAVIGAESSERAWLCEHCVFGADEDES